ncbi:MAG: hypothetical protein M3548_04510 [Actinomycetota bacterium]|nr:hypothetical protein [Actinomycetota bacterium]
MSERTAQREWLLRCEFEDDDLAVCSVEAESGRVAVYCPDHTNIRLSVSQSERFVDALRQAIATAEADVTKQLRPVT